MAKQLNINLNFTANTSQVKQNLTELSTMLNQIANTTPINNLGLSKELQEAKASAKDLQQHIANAFNAKTGNLDLSRLNTSLKESGQNLGTLSANLLKAGTAGEQAFMGLQRSISAASVQINQANGLLTQFWTTLKNTARWQISSSILHGFMGSLQSAWGYAQNLDKSLNNIRIVTGYSADKMAEFAEQANKAAKSLSTTTTAYTNASLIYYQQGLSEKEVLDRTNITVKMANVAGKSAEEVSDQLTAVWNNFYDGSKSLEYYADVMTALGAATASSTDEIAEGLEKFAAVAETVGLSYEYATAALATVTAETRQSADVVGTAFKTLFARLQDLELGETLDDGTTLGKYSEALNVIGINIQGANGELKDMDIILDELGAKWGSLSKDVQVALAQTVAGTRQYTQLIALMDNWETFQENLGTVDTASGTLQAQADIYAESWEAAAARVKATTQGIYADLFPMEDMIDLANGFATILEGIDGIVEGLGGIKGILLLVSTIALHAFQNQIGGAIQSTISKISSLSAVSFNLRKAFTGTVSSTMQLSSNIDQIVAKSGDINAQSTLFTDKFKSAASSATILSQEMINAAISGKTMSSSITTYTSGMSQINNLQVMIEQSNRHLTTEQKEQLSLLQQQAIAANEQSAAAQATLEAARKRQEIILTTPSGALEDADKYEFMGKDQASFGFVSDEVATKTREDSARNLLTIYGEQDLLLTSHKSHIAILTEDESKLLQLNIDSKQAYSDIYTANLRIKSIKEQIAKGGKSDAETQNRQKQSYQVILSSLKTQNNFTGKIIREQIRLVAETHKGEKSWDESKLTLEEIESIINKATSATGTMAKVSGTTATEMKQIRNQAGEIVIAEQQAALQAEDFNNKIQGVSLGLKNALQGAMDTGHIISGMASGLSTVAMGLSSLSNAWDTFNNEEASWIEKLSAGAMGATMGISALMTVMKGATNVINSWNAAKKVKAAIEAAELATTQNLTNAEIANNVVNAMGLAQEEKEAAISSLTTALDQKKTGVTVADTVANWANVASQAAKLWYVTLIIAAIAALVAITVALINTESKEEAALRRTTKTREEMNETLDKSKQKAEEIKTVFEAYVTVVQKLEECTKGTEEWNNALQEAQDKIFEIMRTFPELVSQYDNLITRDLDTGLLTLNTDLFEQIVNEYDKRSMVDAFLATKTSIQRQKDENNLDLVNFKGSVNNYFRKPNDDPEAIAYDYYSTNLSTVIMDNLSDLTNLTLEEYQDTIRQLYKEQGKTSIVDAYDNSISKSVENIDEVLDIVVEGATQYKDIIDELGPKQIQYAQAMDQAYDLLVQQVQPGATAEESNLISAHMQQQAENYKKAYLDLMTHDSGDKEGSDALKTLGIEDKISDTGINRGSEKENEVYDYILEELNKYGINWTADNENAVQGNDEHRDLQFRDENGDPILKSADWIATELSNLRALSEINESTAEAAQLLDNIGVKITELKLGDDVEGQEIAFKKLMTDKNFNTTNLDDIQSLYEAMNSLNADTEKLSKDEVTTYLNKVLGGEDGVLSDDEAKAHGFKLGAKDMINTYYRNLTGAFDTIETVMSDQAYQTTSGLYKQLLSGMSLQGAEAITKSLQKIKLGPLGEAAGTQFVAGLEEMISTVDEDKQKEALEKLATINWSSYDALEQAQKVITELGGDLKNTTTDWEDFANAMRKATNATPDFSSLRTQLAEINKIINDLSFGEVIDDKEYEKLIAYKAAWKDLFVLQADGSRKFIGNEKDMQQVTKEYVQELGKQLHEQQEQANILNSEMEPEEIEALKYDNSKVEQQLGGDGKDGLFEFSEGQKATGILNKLGYAANNGKITDKKNGYEISQQEASRKVIAYQQAENAQQLIQNKPAIQAALQSQDYDEATWIEIINEARNGNDERLKEMMGRLNTLVTQDYEQLDKEYQQMLASTATNITELQELLKSKDIEGAAYDSQLTVLAQNATSLEELQQIREAGFKDEDNEVFGLDTYEYGEALLKLSQNYENCADEAKKYEEALLSGDKQTIEAAQNALEAAIATGELAKQYDLDAQALEDYAQRLQSANKDAKLSTQEATRLAAANMRLDRGLSNLNDNFKDYKKALKDNNKGSAEWSKALSDLKTDLADVLNVADGSMLSDQFAENVMASDDLQKALDGDADAIIRLRAAAADDIMINIVAAQSTTPDTIKTMWQQLKDDFAAIGDIDAPGINQANLIDSFNAMIKAGHMTKEQIEAALSGLHVSANVKTTYISQTQQVPLTVTETTWLPSGEMTVPVPDGNGGTTSETYTSMRRVTKTYDAGTEEAEVVVPQYEIEGTTGEGGNTVAFTSAPPPKASRSSTKSGKAEGKGGSSQPKKTSEARKDKSETVERYKEINDQLDDSSRAMDKASKAADRLYGANRLKALDKLNKALKEEIKNLEAKKKQTEEYLALDRQALDQAAEEMGLGIKFEYDENGNITNYDEMMTIIHNAREALLDSFGDTIDEDEQEQLDAFDKKAENVVDKQEQYDDTREEKEDVEDQIEDAYDQWRDNNYEKLSYALELKLEINDRELELIDTKLDLIADDVFKRAEGLVLLSSKIEPFQETAANLVDQKAILDTALANGDISQEGYVEGLKEIYSAIISNVQAMKEFDEAMKSYYGDTLDMANEEIKKYTDHMEHSVSVLDHYSSLLDIFGESTDYKKMGTILKGQADVLGDQVTVAKQTLEMNKAAADDRWKEYQEALNRGDSAAAELHKEEYFKALAAADEAEENFLAKSEEWAEALKAVLENALKDAGKELEKALTDGMSFDALATKMERASSLQEEYLTNTNKIYETNKMINTAQQAIDKTTNTVAKQRLANFQKETAQLQKKEKLSQYELNIQQAKYDLLLAQITLEEAQQAKSTVRLQRDSEGNFGYVYTADQNQIADAQQKMLDAENALYNKGLEGANDYAQKYQQTMQEMYDTLTEIQEKYLNGEYETYEEYQTAMIEAQDYYYQKLQDYSDLYKVAISADNRVVADAWSSNFSDMVFNTEQWMVAVTGYIGDVSLKFQEWDTTVKTLKEGTLGDNLEDLSGKVKNITDESKSLVQTLTDEKDGVIPNLAKEIEGVGTLTSEYGKNREALLLLTDAQLDYAESVHKTVEAQAKLLTANGDDSESNSSSGSNSGSSSSSSSGSSSGGDSGSGSSNDVNKPTSPTGPKEKPTTPPGIKLYMSGDLTGGTKTFSADKIKSMIPEGNDGKLYRAVYRAEDHGSEYIYTNKEQADKYNNYIASLDTGGYTGSWGHEGKLAMLHEKELILNAQDTSNFLASLEVLREIMKTIDLHSSYAQISGMLSSPIYRDYNEPQTLEQQVHIEASFPGVQDRNEIEEAFNNLMNRAAQFVNRK